MARSSATTPDEYIASLPADRREAVATVREVVNRNLPPGYEEGMAYGMIGWWVPLETFPDTYNGQPLGLAGLASQKNYISLYLNTVYGSRDEEAWFKDRYAASGKKLNMGKTLPPLPPPRRGAARRDRRDDCPRRSRPDIGAIRRGARLVEEDASGGEVTARFLMLGSVPECVESRMRRGNRNLE